VNRIVQTREAFKLALSLALTYALSLWMDWDMPKYGALAIVLISLGTAGASLQKGILRIVGTTAGLAVGMFLLACFAQDRWLALLFMMGWLFVVSYFMQGSPNPYAWFVAGFMVSLIWSSTYMKVESAFHFATFRYLETTAGVLIYTLVSALFWPILARDHLGPQGAKLWQGLGELLEHGREQITAKSGEHFPSESRMELEGTFVNLSQTLRTATNESSRVRRCRAVWMRLLRKTEALLRELEPWHKSLRACKDLDLHACLPGLEQHLQRLEAQVAQVARLWAGLCSSEDAVEIDALPAAAKLRLEPVSLQDLERDQRGRLAAFWRRTIAVGEINEHVLDLCQLLQDEKPARAGRLAAERYPLPKPIHWHPERLRSACLPPLTLALGFYFWIFTDPPSGSGVPNFAAILSLVMVLSPFPLLPLLIAFLGSIVFAVAPVYFFLMPALQGGIGLLSLIFVFSFVFGMLGSVSPVLKLGPLAMFVMLTGISNHQSYSLMSMINPAMMMLLAFTCLWMVQGLMFPRKPEEKILANLRAYFRACAAYLGDFAGSRSDPASSQRRRASTHLCKLPNELAKLKSKLPAEASREAIGRLADRARSLSLGLHALQDDHPAQVDATSLPTLSDQAEASLASWQRLESGDPIDAQSILASADAGLARPDQPDSYVFLGALATVLDDLSAIRHCMQDCDWGAGWDHEHATNSKPSPTCGLTSARSPGLHGRARLRTSRSRSEFDLALRRRRASECGTASRQ
jgi:uncharacterized membrane protein YccC